VEGLFTYCRAVSAVALACALAAVGCGGSSAGGSAGTGGGATAGSGIGGGAGTGGGAAAGTGGDGVGGSAAVGSGGVTGTGGIGGATGGSNVGGTGGGGAGVAGAAGVGGSGGNGGRGGRGGSGGSGGRGGTAAAGTGGAAGVVGSGGNGGRGGSGGSSGGAGGATSHAADAAYCAQQIAQAASDFAHFRTTYTNPTSIPRSAKGGTARMVNASDWTSGFPAGSFWLLYERTKDQAWRTAAESWTAALASQQTRTDTHDVGFIINCSFGNGYRLTQTASYKTVITTAAGSLASRYNATVGCTRSWDFGSWMFPVIIDNMMNLELLYRATALGGDARYKTIGTTHAATTRTNHFRADASSYHLVDYNPTTGAVIKKQTNQGLADESAWARGQAWGLYGFTMSYRETNDARFLDQATRIADFYTQSPRMPADGVPYFDFDAPVRDDVPDYRDASAGAIAASGLFELAQYASGAAAERYRAFAIKAVRSLSSASYRAATGTNNQFLLMHSVGNYPQNDEVDVAMNYADYYYLEALGRCADLQ
jgi:unsaturated chondroitin disaccharide hydrolase